MVSTEKSPVATALAYGNFFGGALVVEMGENGELSRSAIESRPEIGMDDETIVEAIRMLVEVGLISAQEDVLTLTEEGNRIYQRLLLMLAN